MNKTKEIILFNTTQENDIKYTMLNKLNKPLRIKPRKRDTAFKHIFLKMISAKYEYNNSYYDKNNIEIPIKYVYDTLVSYHIVMRTMPELNIEFAKYINRQIDKLLVLYAPLLGLDFDGDLIIDYRGLTNTKHKGCNLRVINGLNTHKYIATKKYNKRVKNRNKLYNKKRGL